LAAAFVKCTLLQSTTSGTASGAVTSTAGNALIIGTGAYYAGAAASPTLSVSGGGTWTSNTTNNQHFTSTNDNFVLGFASCPSATGGSQTITVTWAGGPTYTVSTAYVYEFSGMASSSMLDVAGTGQQGSTSPIASTSLTSTNAADAFLMVSGTYTGSSSDTYGTPTNSWTTPTNGSQPSNTGFSGVSAYRIVTAAGANSTSVSVTPSEPWASLIVCYKAAPTGTTYNLSGSIAQAQSASVAAHAVHIYALSGSIAQTQTLSVALAHVTLPSNYYHTTFPLTENPISEGGVWTLGGTDGVAWTNPRTTTNRAFGTQSGTDSPPYTDSIGVLKGTWGNDQEVFVSVGAVAPPSGSYYAEIELLLRFTVGASSTTGYECDVSVNASNNYWVVNRWTGGPPGNLSSYAQVGAMAHSTVSVGDVIHATVVGSTITLYQNGTQILQVTDTNVTSGKPGMGFYDQDNGAHVAASTYYLTNLTAHTVGTAWPLGGTNPQSQVLQLGQQVQLQRALSVSQPVALLAPVNHPIARSLAQAQTLALSRVLGLPRALAQAQTVSLAALKVVPRVVNVSQAQTARLLRAVNLNRLLSVAQLLTSIRGLSLTRAFTQAEVATVSAVHSSNATYNLSGSAAQTQAVSVASGRVRLLSGSVQQHQAVSISVTHITGLAALWALLADQFQTAGAYPPTYWASTGQFQLSGTGVPAVDWDAVGRQFTKGH
jgi:hypothetical protein